MDKLEDKLHSLSKITPSRGFIRASKNRILQQIELQKHENWFLAFLKKVAPVNPDSPFLSMARLRLMQRITQPARPFTAPLLVLKRAVASTLVMLLAVTSTLFFVEGNTIVEASDDSYLEVLSGSVSVKHADLLLWEDIGGQIEVQAGDLIKVKEDSQAVVHFFDDTELRLGENSIFLISQLAVSPSFGRQGIIEISLHEGNAWVQTLNVNDGYAGITLSTRDSFIKALNATFCVKTTPEQPTEVQVHNNKIELTTLRPETRQAGKTLKVAAGEKADVRVIGQNADPVTTLSSLTEQDLATEWTQNNLKLDYRHLTSLREKGFDRLTQMAGTLPGDMLYPVKQAKERLKLLVFGNDPDRAVQIEVANNRLNEAIVLIENGDIEKGRKALIAYQSLARELARETNEPDIAHRLLTPHQKALTAELPNDANIGLVKETLQETAEILAENPIELERIKLVNSVDRLRDILGLVEMADFAAARDRLVSHQLSGSDVLAAIQNMEDQEAKKEIVQEVLELRKEEITLLDTISRSMTAVSDTDKQLVAMLESATESAEENVDATIAFATPLIPELVAQVTAPPTDQEIRIARLVDKIYIYNSWDGQRNQIERLLKHEFENTNSLNYLMAVKKSLTGRAADYMNVHILQLQKKAELQKHKAVQKKIERAQHLRES